MELKDALFNWLQTKVVWEKRPTDMSARDTAKFFKEIVKEDHKVTDLDVSCKEDLYVVTCIIDDENKTFEFSKHNVDKLFNDILSEPKYNQLFN